MTSPTPWTFTDHLGTPLIQTTESQAVWWRAEYEPYGRVFAYNPIGLADQHQPLRLPGQESEQLNLGPNGATERSYNIFRWYRPNWGRYTQPDPLESAVFGNTFIYAASNPHRWTDRFGLYHSGDVIYRCPPTGVLKSCDVVTVLYDPTPSDDNNGDEFVIAYGDPHGCAAPCTGTAHLTHLSGPTDPYAGYVVKGVCSQLAFYEEIAQRWGHWRRKDPAWTPMGSQPLSQCFNLVNQLTGVGDVGHIELQWGWPPVQFPIIEHDLGWWKTKCRAK